MTIHPPEGHKNYRICNENSKLALQICERVCVSTMLGLEARTTEGGQAAGEVSAAKGSDLSRREGHTAQDPQRYAKNAALTQ